MGSHTSIIFQIVMEILSLITLEMVNVTTFCSDIRNESNTWGSLFRVTFSTGALR